MLSNGGDCLADQRAARDQVALLGAVASDSTAFRVIERIASSPGMIEALDRAHATARAHVWNQTVARERVTIDVDGTLLTAHSEKDCAAGTFKRGYGFHPLLAYCDETRESLAGALRPGNAGANTAADQIGVAEAALEKVRRARLRLQVGMGMPRSVTRPVGLRVEHGLLHPSGASRDDPDTEVCRVEFFAVEPRGPDDVSTNGTW